MDYDDTPPHNVNMVLKVFHLAMMDYQPHHYDGIGTHYDKRGNKYTHAQPHSELGRLLRRKSRKPGKLWA